MTGARTPIALGALLLLAAFGLGAPALVLPGVALLLMGALLTAWTRLAADGVVVSRSSLPARVDEGQPFELVHRVEAGRLPLAGVLVDPLLEEPRPLRGSRFDGTIEVRGRGRIERRGRHLLPGPSVRISDPLGVASRTVGSEGPTAVLVLPRVERVSFAPGEGPSGGRRLAAAGELADEGLRESAADPELEGLRPYRPGTRASRIYWPALARGDDLLERHLSPAADSGPLIVLDTRDPADPDALDRAVRAAASVAAHLARLGGCELMIGGDHRSWRVSDDPATLLEARSALALVSERDGAPRSARLASVTTLVWITAGRSRPPLGRRTTGLLIGPERLPGRDPLMAVAGCFGYPLRTGAGRLGLGAAA